MLSKLIFYLFVLTRRSKSQQRNNGKTLPFDLTAAEIDITYRLMNAFRQVDMTKNFYFRLVSPHANSEL